MSSLKSKVNKLDVDKLEPVPVDFIKLSDVAEKEVAKKMYGMNWLKKFYAIDSLILVLIMLLKKDTKRYWYSNKKKDYDAKISEIENKYSTPSDYNKFTNDILDGKIKK